MSEPEPGDKVSWSWGSGQPGGTVAEKKTEGEIAITSKRGNKIKKNADKDDPAVHVERSGNDVVKKASELSVEKKASKGSKSDEKKEEKKEDKKGEKRKHDEVSKDNEGDNDGNPLVENEDGKEVKPGGKDAHKKQKTGGKAEQPKEDKKEEKKEEDKKKGAESTTKAKPGRPKKGEESKKQKKQATPRQEGDLVSSRTRSRNK